MPIFFVIVISTRGEILLVPPQTQLYSKMLVVGNHKGLPLQNHNII
ncbi:MAG: hypothetical protein ABFS56_05720 [Pseudomonadota bacterium]